VFALRNIESALNDPPICTKNRGVGEHELCPRLIDPRLFSAVLQGLIIGVFVARQMAPGNSCEFSRQVGGPTGFVGHEAPEDIAKLCLRRRLPDSMRKRGAANAVKFPL